MKKQCINCKFFESKNSFCRRFPPTVVVEEREIHEDRSNYGNSVSKNRQIIMTKFPVIIKPELDWCGEWEDGDSQENFV
jgi:Fe-S-cluster containining protein